MNGFPSPEERREEAVRRLVHYGRALESFMENGEYSKARHICNMAMDALREAAPERRREFENLLSTF